MFRIVGCTHINAQTAVLVETLVALGAQVHQVDVGLRSEGKTKPAVLRYCPIRPRTLCENSLKPVNDTVYCKKKLNLSFAVSHYSPTVLPVQFRIFRPKTYEYIFNLSAVSFLLDPDPRTIIPDPGKSPDSVSTTLAKTT